MHLVERYSFFSLLAYAAAAVGCAESGGDLQVLTGGTGTGATSGTGSTHTTGGSTFPGTGGTTIIPPDPMTCGDGKLQTNELCDDANENAGDGCDVFCQVEADWVCEVPGQPCRYAAVCGDGKLASAEACDDYNAIGGDGCSADCLLVEPGWQCRVPGRRCVPFCGDSNIVPGAETCDDGNSNSEDGCSSTCMTEPGYDCSSGTCIKALCGNSAKEVGEACDLGPQNGIFYGDGSGCSKTCTNEPTCRDLTTGKTIACITRCGDGNIDPGEACDDGNGNDGDGCSAACVVEPGITCDPVQAPDTTPCTTGGGNCLIVPIIYRDFDGQNVTGGHPDFFYYQKGKTTCVPNASGLADNSSSSNCPTTDSTDLCSGLVASNLGPDGKPVIAGDSTCACRFTDWDQTGIVTATNGTQCTVEGDGSTRYTLSATTKVIESAQSFNDWYHDTGVGNRVAGVLELEDIGDNAYQFSSSDGRTVYDDLHDICTEERGSGTLTAGFFPLDPPVTSAPALVCNIWPYWEPGLDDECCAGSGCPVESQWDPLATWNECPKEGDGGPLPQESGLGDPVEGELHNFYFTSEARYLFRFDGQPQQLRFFGDDDVWVFINGTLVLDLGAPHERLQGTVDFDGATATYEIEARDITRGSDIPVDDGTGTVPLPLEAGRTYEIAVFHADRHPRESNYQLTLFGFGTTKSACEATCGDGIIAAGEECDDGAGNLNPADAYNACTTECKFGPFCGDGAINGPEICDKGRANGVPYGNEGCTTACTPSHFCGDGITDSQYNEQCDLGTKNGGSQCSSECKKQLY